MSAIMQALALPGFSELIRRHRFSDGAWVLCWMANAHACASGDSMLVGVGATAEQACINLLAAHDPPIAVAPKSPTAADIACDHVLHRIQADPDFAHFFWYTEGFRRLCEAQADYTGQTVDEVEAQRKVTNFRGRERRYLNESEWKERRRP